MELSREQTKSDHISFSLEQDDSKRCHQEKVRVLFGWDGDERERGDETEVTFTCNDRFRTATRHKVQSPTLYN